MIKFKLGIIWYPFIYLEFDLF